MACFALHLDRNQVEAKKVLPASDRNLTVKRCKMLWPVLNRYLPPKMGQICEPKMSCDIIKQNCEVNR